MNILRLKWTRFYRKWVKKVDRYRGGSVMMWVGITATNRTDMVLFESKVDAGVYLDEGADPLCGFYFKENIEIFSYSNKRM